MTTFLALSELLDPVRARVHTIALDKDAAEILGFTYLTVADSGERQFFAAPDERAARMTHDLVADQLKRRRSPIITKCEACGDPMTGKLGLCPVCIQKPPAPVKKATALKAAPAKKAAPPAPEPEPEAVTPEASPEASSARRTFTQDFKDMIVKLCAEPDASVADVARENNLDEGLVRRWIRTAREPVGVPA